VKQWHRTAIALGANLGDRLETLRRAARAITEDVLESAKSSRVYETPPWGITEQPEFLNAVIVGETEWKPPALLHYLKALEAELGRVPGPRFGPRHLDLDLLAWGEECWESDGVTVPHLRLAEREFVLLPWNDVWPEWRHPKEGLTVSEMLERLRRTQPAAAKAIAPHLLDTTSP
jgi:2-amino-4-hydroxy-6-hydroxymethyldihydropteridine diphosphokinase